MEEVTGQGFVQAPQLHVKTQQLLVLCCPRQASKQNINEGMTVRAKSVRARIGARAKSVKAKYKSAKYVRAKSTKYKSSKSEVRTRCIV